jgi:hypothetical protein
MRNWRSLSWAFVRKEAFMLRAELSQNVFVRSARTGFAAR